MFEQAIKTDVACVIICWITIDICTMFNVYKFIMKEQKFLLKIEKKKRHTLGIHDYMYVHMTVTLNVLR